MNKRDYHEIFDEIDPEDQAIADLLRRTSFAPSPTYQANLWKKLTHYQNQPYYERKARMSSSLWTILSSKTLRLGLTAAVSSVLTVIIILGATLVFSPQARAQVQQLIARFVEVDSPEDFLAEQIKARQAAREAIKAESAPTEDQAATSEGETIVQNGDNTVTPVEGDTAAQPSPIERKGSLDQIISQMPHPVESPPADISPPVVQRSDVANSANLVPLEEAQSRVSFTIRTATWLPEGYNLQGVMVPPDLSSALPAGAAQLPTPGFANVHYSNDTGDILLLSQMYRPPLELPGDASREVLLPVPKDKGKVQDVTINGQAGQYIELGSGQHQLHWQDTEGMMYDLMSATLDQATLISIAESVK